MFVNISPVEYNQDETVTSLTYAARVKEIKNTASKNADNKEVAKLKEIIRKLKAGETIEEEDEIWLWNFFKFTALFFLQKYIFSRKIQYLQ